MRKGILYSIVALLITALFAGAFSLSFWLLKKIDADRQSALDAQNRDLSQQISTIKSQINQLDSSQPKNEEVTAVVGKNVGSVVSLIVSKNIPQYKIIYQDPFGREQASPGDGFQIPVYLPTGKFETQEVGAGSGFFLTSNGYILTNKHVVNGSQVSYTVLLSDGTKRPAKVIYRDPKLDLAIVKADGENYPAIAIGDSGGLRLGQSVIAIGNALGKYNNTVSVGVISGLNRSVQVMDDLGNVENISDVIQTDAPVNPGNSGGPLLDMDGKVVGINVAAELDSNNISFAIPINTAKGVIDKAVKTENK